MILKSRKTSVENCFVGDYERFLDSIIIMQPKPGCDMFLCPRSREISPTLLAIHANNFSFFNIVTSSWQALIKTCFFFNYDEGEFSNRATGKYCFSQPRSNILF